MKLKEYPISFVTSLKYAFKNSAELAKADPNALDVVVSLTSIPSRFSILHLTLKSVLSQKPKPKRVYLWLNEHHKNLIPKKVSQLEGEVLQIKFTHLTCPHKKLIHTLKEEPSLPIVTCDDDVLYRKNWLHSLYASYQRTPNQIIAHRVRCISFDKNGQLLPYKNWVCTSNAKPKRIMPIGVEGVLYPPGIFSDKIQDEALFLKLAPKSDDLWFKAIALHENITSRAADTSPKPSIPIANTQKISLKNFNVKKDMNYTQWLDLMAYFKLDL